MKNEKYSITTRSLHWISAIVILWATLSGFYVMLQNTEEHIQLRVTELNISITTVFIPIFFFRILNYLFSKRPSYPASISTFEIRLAKMMHNFIYFLVSIVLLSGILMMDSPILVFSFFQLPLLLNNSEIIIYFSILHNYSTKLLSICIFFHIVGLFKHEMKGSKILKRMI